MNRKPIITRFAPSPTGLLQAGNYRTAVFSYLFARHHGGKFILRIEDTDKARSKKEYEDNIIESLAWLGLEYDEKFLQSERFEIHKKLLQKLVEEDRAYVSKEKNVKEGDRAEVIRFRNPNKKVSWVDAIRGKVEFDTTELGDFVIAKSFEEPIFHFAVVVDDGTMGITHVIRGEDHISNTPRQILIYEALGLEVPVFAHLPLVLAPDRSKLSKRKGAKAMTEYRKEGFLPEALINYMALVGWNPGTEQEIFTKKELVKDFSLERVQKSGAIFSEEKLRWVNKEHIKKMPVDKQINVAKEILCDIGINESLLTPSLLNRLTPIIFDRIETFGDIKKMYADGELEYYFSRPKIVPQKLLWKGQGSLSDVSKHLKAVSSLLESVSPANWTAEGVKTAIWKYAEEVGRGAVLWPLRFALSGRDKSPDPFTLCFVLGKEETLARLKESVI